MSLLSLAFWIKDSSNYLTHANGLTFEQVEDLKNLKEGDRLILWREDRSKGSGAALTLKVFRKAPEQPKTEVKNDWE